MCMHGVKGESLKKSQLTGGGVALTFRASQSHSWVLHILWPSMYGLINVLKSPPRMWDKYFSSRGWSVCWIMWWKRAVSARALF